LESAAERMRVNRIVGMDFQISFRAMFGLL
jgi:hypothetical protein